MRRPEIGRDFRRGLSEIRAGWARTDLYTDVTMTNFGQNPVQATRTNKYTQLEREMDNDGGDCI